MAIAVIPASSSAVSLPVATGSILLTGSLNSATATVSTTVPTGTYQIVSAFALGITSGTFSATSAGAYVPVNMIVTSAQTSIILTNPTANAIAYTARTFPTPAPASYRGLAASSTRYVVVATGATGVSLTSTDGINWTTTTLPSSVTTWGLAASDGTRFGLVNSSNPATANSNYAYSADGVTWTLGSMPLSRVWELIAYANNLWFAIVQVSTTMATSTDGINWTSRTRASAGQAAAVVYAQSLYFIFGGSTNYESSPNGSAWTMLTNLPALPNDAASDGTNLVVTGTVASVYRSTNAGVSWSTIALPAGMTSAQIKWTGTQFVAVTGAASRLAATSPTGVTWTQRATAATVTDGIQYMANKGEDILWTSSATTGNYQTALGPSNPFSIFSPPSTVY